MSKAGGRSGRIVALIGALALLAVGKTPALRAAAPPSQAAFAVGVPTVVDPVRGVGEPDIAIDSANNAWITGPGGSSTQTSFFWHSTDGGLTYPMAGPSGGHWVCPVSGGGDSLVALDRVNGNVYLTDQEALASPGPGAPRVPAAP
jgi:hypothetical protein